MAKKSQTSRKVNVLFPCIGRRVSLLRSFRSAARALNIKSIMIGTDATELSSALQLCDKRFVIVPVTHRDYVKNLLSIVKAEKVKLVVPTVDLDLKVLTENTEKFEKAGCKVLVSSPKVVDICQDKRKTYRFLVSNSFDTPRTISPKEAIKKKSFGGPYFMKPWNGYAGRGNAIIKNKRELEFYSKHIPNPICQEYVEGTEHTCDVYVDFNMKVRCVVPRKRIEVRAGEVNKAQVVKNTEIMDQAAHVVEKLGAGPGVITIQLFINKRGKTKFIEINPRFGGGAPLSIKAGADFPKWLLQELTGQKPSIRFDGFRDGLMMLRYDAEVWK
ncbi:MAG: ATP-grasp domain-containing protein [Sedimentisphaerales bacterium]|nr:ATP-grasp domain-containing protein [Sedimentisphaerales bacterium]